VLLFGGWWWFSSATPVYLSSELGFDCSW